MVKQVIVTLGGDIQRRSFLCKGVLNRHRWALSLRFPIVFAALCFSATSPAGAQSTILLEKTRPSPSSSPTDEEHDPSATQSVATPTLPDPPPAFLVSPGLSDEERKHLKILLDRAMQSGDADELENYFASLALVIVFEELRYMRQMLDTAEQAIAVEPTSIKAQLMVHREVLHKQLEMLETSLNEEIQRAVANEDWKRLEDYALVRPASTPASTRRRDQDTFRTAYLRRQLEFTDQVTRARALFAERKRMVDAGVNPEQLYPFLLERLSNPWRQGGTQPFVEQPTANGRQKRMRVAAVTLATEYFKALRVFYARLSEQERQTRKVLASAGFEQLFIDGFLDGNSMQKWNLIVRSAEEETAKRELKTQLGQQRRKQLKLSSIRAKAWLKDPFTVPPDGPRNQQLDAKLATAARLLREYLIAVGITVHPHSQISDEELNLRREFAAMGLEVEEIHNFLQWVLDTRMPNVAAAMVGLHDLAQ